MSEHDPDRYDAEAQNSDAHESDSGIRPGDDDAPHVFDGADALEEDEELEDASQTDDAQEAHLVLIVTGAHLRAEIADRPLAYQLRTQIEDWVEQHAKVLTQPIAAVVCSDVWYLNQEGLQRHPTISLGGPGVNALSAYYFKRLETAFVREDEMIIQLDPEYVDLRVCIWGRDHERTVDTMGVFCERFLDGFLRAVVTQVEPEVDSQ